MHTSRTNQGRAVPLTQQKKHRQFSGLLLATVTFFCIHPLQASVVGFSGGPTTTQTDGELYFSPLSGQVSTIFSDSASFGIANVSGVLAIAFNTTPDGALVMAPNSGSPSLSTVARLSSGAVVGAGNRFDNTEYTVAESDGLIGNWNGLGSGFFGFRFGTGTDVHYGWASITVLPNYNITLNSFAYETVSGQPITVAAAPVPEPSSFALVGGFSLLCLLIGIRRRLRLQARAVSVALGLVAVSTVLPAQTSTPLPGQTDPVGGHLMQFRSDHLFSITQNPSDNSSNTVLNTYGVQYGNNPFSTSLSSTSNTTQTSTVNGRQYHSVSGHFLQPDHEDVVIAYANGSSIDVQVVGQPNTSLSLPTSVLPRFQTIQGGSRDTVDFIAMAAGDLDHAVDSSGNYHDEAVIAYVTSQNTYNVVVLDFSGSNVADSDTGDTTPQPPTYIEFQALERLQFNPAMMLNGTVAQSPPGHVLPFDNILSVTVGDFDGDGIGEIAVSAINYQPTQDNNPDTTLSVQTLRYRPEQQSILEIGISSLSPPNINEGSTTGAAYLGANLTMASGDYEGRGADDVAFGYFAYGPPLSLTDEKQIYPSFVMHLLSAPTLTSQSQTTIQANLQPSSGPGQPSTLTLNLGQTPLGSIPQQLTIINAQDSNNDSAWSALIGTWQTTFTSTPNPGRPINISIPADTSGLNGQLTSGTVTVYLSSPLAPVPSSLPVQTQLDPFDNINLSSYDYPRIQLVSGLFKYDPANGWDFSRRQLAAVWNNPPCQSKSCSSRANTIGVNLYTVDSPYGVPGFSSAAYIGLQPPANGADAAQRVSATAGAFRGTTVINSDGTQNYPPIWSLAINAWYDNSQDYVYILEPDSNASFNMSSQSFATGPVDTNARLAVVNYDSDGSSVYLGVPIHLSASNIHTPITIIKEPPKHLAWFQDLSKCSPDLSGPGPCNVSRNDGFNVQFADSSSNEIKTTTQQQKSSDFSTTDSISASLSIKETVFPGISNKFSVSDTATFGYDTSHTDSTYYENSGKVSYASGASTNYDDYLQVQAQNLDIWRYRVYYSANGSNSRPYSFYDLTYPSAPVDVSTAGLLNDFYVPVHENGNLLSYSPLPSSLLPDDVGQPYKVNGTAAPTAVLFYDKEFCFGGVSANANITMDSVTSSSSTVETSRTISWDNDTHVGETVKVGGAKISTSADVDLGGKQSLSQSASTVNTTTGSTSVTLNVDAGDSTKAYGIWPVFYNSSAGVLKFTDYVYIPTATSTASCGEGGKWWTDNYGGAADPALALPYRFSYGGYDTSTDTTTWNLNTDLEREQLRSFFLTSGTKNDVESTSDNPVYTPVSTHPVEGSKVRMAVPVYNFSLGQAAQNVTVQFSVVPYDSNHDNELACGTPAATETGRHCAPNIRTVLGTAPVLSSIPAWGGSGTSANWQMAEYFWTIPNGFTASQNTSEFRVYVNLSTSGAELNPPQAPCNNSPASEPVPCLPIAYSLSNVTSSNYWDPNAPGQNNEGYSYITIQPAAQTTSAPAVSALTTTNIKSAKVLRAALNGEPAELSSPANLKTAPDSLAAVDTAGQLKSGLVVAYLGRRLHVRVKAQSEGNDVHELQKARVLEGSGPGQKTIALKALRGVSLNGTSAWFHWTPTTLGLHQLTAEILEPQDDLTKGDNTAKLSVVVVRAPGDVNGDGSVDALDTEIVRQQIGKSTAESACGTACDLNGDGFIGKADLELTMMHCDNTSCAISHTLPSKIEKKQKQVAQR